MSTQPKPREWTLKMEPSPHGPYMLVVSGPGLILGETKVVREVSKDEIRVNRRDWNYLKTDLLSWVNDYEFNEIAKRLFARIERGQGE